MSIVPSFHYRNILRQKKKLSSAKRKTRLACKPNVLFAEPFNGRLNVFGERVGGSTGAKQEGDAAASRRRRVQPEGRNRMSLATKSLSREISKQAPEVLPRASRARRFGIDCESELRWHAKEPGGDYKQKLLIKNVSNQVLLVAVVPTRALCFLSTSIAAGHAS